MKRDFLWVEKYRPTKIDECILPEGSKKSFQGFLDQGEIPNLLLSGPAGVGKTTVARALCDQLGASYLLINGSDEVVLSIPSETRSSSLLPASH